MDKSRQESEPIAAVEEGGTSDIASKEDDFTTPAAPPVLTGPLVKASELAPEEVEKLVAELAELKRANIGLESEKMRNEAIIADLEEANRQNEEFISVLEGERERYRAEVSSLKEDRAGWMSQLWVLKKTYNDYTQTIEAYERCCERQAAEIESLREKLAELGCADALFGDSAQEGEDIQVKQPTEPLPIVGNIVEPLAGVEAAEPHEQAPASGDAARDAGKAEPAAQPAPEDSQPLDLLDSEKLHEALEASAFFEDREQPASFSMPKGRLSR